MALSDPVAHKLMPYYNQFNLCKFLAFGIRLHIFTAIFFRQKSVPLAKKKKAIKVLDRLCKALVGRHEICRPDVCGRNIIEKKEVQWCDQSLGCKKAVAAERAIQRRGRKRGGKKEC